MLLAHLPQFQRGRMSWLSPSQLDTCIETLQSGECVSERALKKLCIAVSELMMEESNVQPVLSPVTVRLSDEHLVTVCSFSFCRLWVISMANFLIC